MTANLILKNALVYTVDPERSQVQAIAISENKILFVGSNEDVTRYIEADTTVVDLGGKLVLPAFVDSHMHPAHGAYLYQYQLSLFNVTGGDLIQAYLQVIREFVRAHPSSSWIIGGG